MSINIENIKLSQNCNTRLDGKIDSFMTIRDSTSSLGHLNFTKWFAKFYHIKKEHAKQLKKLKKVRFSRGHLSNTRSIFDLFKFCQWISEAHRQYYLTVAKRFVKTKLCVTSLPDLSINIIITNKITYTYIFLRTWITDRLILEDDILWTRQNSWCVGTLCIKEILRSLSMSSFVPDPFSILQTNLSAAGFTD